MNEHKHILGQGFNIAHMEEYVWCIKCKKRWNKIEVQAAINATGELDAATAIGASVTVSAERQSKALLAYAAALEEK